ncbi:hypothetical protein K438DRAFT_1969653 [Mycena galopus ATCC 62051]|nr:hypothetical protein K438DRAFT_1969653 [Mycena galopus ATCC 62051]
MDARTARTVVSFLRKAISVPARRPRPAFLEKERASCSSKGSLALPQNIHEPVAVSCRRTMLLTSTNCIGEIIFSFEASISFAREAGIRSPPVSSFAYVHALRPSNWQALTSVLALSRSKCLRLQGHAPGRSPSCPASSLASPCIAREEAWRGLPHLGFFPISLSMPCWGMSRVPSRQRKSRIELLEEHRSDHRCKWRLCCTNSKYIYDCSPVPLPKDSRPRLGTVALYSPARSALPLLPPHAPTEFHLFSGSASSTPSTLAFSDFALLRAVVHLSSVLPAPPTTRALRLSTTGMCYSREVEDIEDAEHDAL